MKSSYYKGFVLHLLMRKLTVVITEFLSPNFPTPTVSKPNNYLSDLIKKQHH
ncbi:hypothetical protein [Flavobacterium sp. ZS1P14]|uniref:hypothetical protein n=1 Tax=Flavobacterium sp. ZS1P14 TaxID=3401729 RepID=UPI003AB0E084